MRTTLTLEPDVEGLLDAYRKEHDLGLKEAVNEALRRGLAPDSKKGRPKRKFVTKVVDHGRPKVANIDDIGGLIGLMDDEGGA